MTKTYQNLSNNDGYMSISDVWDIVVIERKKIASIAVIFILIGTLFTIFTTPIYRAESLLISADDQSNSSSGLSSLVSQYSGVASLAGINLGSGGSNGTYEALAILQSRKFIEQFIKDEDLLSTLFYDEWDDRNSTWKDKKPSMEKAYKRMLEISSVSLNLDTRIITFAIEWKDPFKAADWANLMIKKVNSDIRGRAIQDAQKSIGYLLDQRNTISLVNTQNVLSSLVEKQTENIMIANVREQYAFKVIDPAMPPDDPDRPNKLLNIIVSILSGFIAGILIVLFQNTKRQT